ncbi:MAG: hypothetical protein NT180_00860 [Actinobacteria bacterium]|nr:hypothetical protein [Actinomycetota bacterium]
MRLSLRLGSALTICLFGASTVAPIAVQAMPISAAPAKLLPGGPAAIYIRPSPDETRFSLMSRQIGGKTAVVGNVQKTDGAITLFPSSSQDGRVVVVMQIGRRSAKHILVIRDGRLALDIPVNADVTTSLPVVSLDGRRVVYPSSRNTLASLNVETGTATELCPECRFTNVSTGVVFPNGKFVAVVQSSGVGDYQNAIFALDSGQMIARRNSHGMGLVKPTWSPYSAMIVYSRIQPGFNGLWTLSVKGIAKSTAFRVKLASEVVGQVAIWSSPAWINGRLYAAGFEYVDPQNFLSVAYSAATPFDTPQRLGVIGPFRGSSNGPLSALVVAWSSRQPK